MHRLALKAYITTRNRYYELRELGDERGLTTTEIAVLTFILVATAGVVGTLLFQYAKGRVDSLPDDPAPNIEADG